MAKAKIYLYKEGNECVSLTGGWETRGTTSEKLSNSLHLKQTAYWSTVRTSNILDINNNFYVEYKYTRTKSEVAPYNNFRLTTEPGSNVLMEFPTSDTRKIINKTLIANGQLDFGTSTSAGVSEQYIYNVWYETKENVLTIHFQTDDNITFSANDLGLVTISKIDVSVNGIVSKTYTGNYSNLSYAIDKSLLTIGSNTIEIKVTYNQGDGISETASEYLIHKVTVNKLPLETPLLDAVERVKLLNESKQNEKNILSSILTSKNVEVSEADKMSDLIYKVNDLGEFIQPILYIYKEGDECINVTGGWDFNNCSYSSAFSKNNGHLTKNSTNFYGTLPTYWSIYYRGTSNKIDLSNYNKLKCKISNYTSATNSAFDIYVSYEDANFLNKTPVASARNTTTGESVLELDISQIFSAYNIFISLFCGSASGGAGASVTVSEIWLEV